MAVSVFDLFKIGIGPSSSHTVGPMRAARLFMQRLLAEGVLARTARIRCELFGSLGATGKGHGSDKAVILGLAGHDPETVDVEAIPALLQSMRSQARLRFVQGSISHEWGFTEAQDLVFNRRTALPFHANGMSLTAWAADGQELCTRRYYSVGGGFVVSEELAADGTRHARVAPDTTVLPHPFHSGQDLLDMTAAQGLSISELMRRNECHWQSATA
ncbi:MAG: serine dehydratase beta chain, partial [Betaproteobacteria bacterium]